jgi:antitoxin Phd
MTMFTDQQAVRQMDTVLDAARRQGEVRIKAADGQEFSLRPVLRGKSPLDIPGVDLRLSAQDIVQAVRDGRDR